MSTSLSFAKVTYLRQLWVIQDVVLISNGNHARNTVSVLICGTNVSWESHLGPDSFDLVELVLRSAFIVIRQFNREAL